MQITSFAANGTNFKYLERERERERERAIFEGTFATRNRGHMQHFWDICNHRGHLQH